MIYLSMAPHLSSKKIFKMSLIQSDWDGLALDPKFNDLKRNVAILWKVAMSLP